MRTIPIMLCFVSIAAAADASWIEGSWQWSRERTIEALSQGVSEAKASLEKGLPLAGATWILDSGQLEVIRDGRTSGKMNYFIRPIDDDRFELLHDTPDGEQIYVIIRKTDFGFCSRWGGDYSKPPMPAEYETCYVPTDAQQGDKAGF